MVLGVEILFGPLLVTSLLGFTTLVLLIWASRRNHDYWKKLGIPFDKPLPFLGSVYGNLKKPLHETELERYLRLGRIYGHFEGNSPLLSVGEPDLLRQILVKDFQNFASRRNISTGDEIVDKMMSVVNGEDWKRIRTIVTPTFTTGKIRRMLNIFKECSNSLIQNFHTETKKGKPVDAKRLYGAYTMDVIASSAFSTKIDSHNDPDNKFVKTAREVFARNFSWRLIMFLLAPRIMKIFRIGVFIPSVMDFFKNVTLEIIKERKRTGQKRNDFLQLLMDTAQEVAEEDKWFEKNADDISTNYGEDDTNHQVFNSVTDKRMSMNELIAQCVIFFIAGYDTTASTLSYVSYNLALNPHIQDKVRAEVDAAIKAANGKLTYEALQSMKYLDNVISENLRLFPPAVRLERVADADYSLGDTGITIPKGMIITIPNYAMHRDPELYPDPEKFDPDRFTQEEREKRDQYAYLPFGAGPRNCVGMRFALMEVKVCLIQVLCHFNIQRCPETKVPLDYFIGQGLLQPKNIIFKLEARTDCPLKE